MKTMSNVDSDQTAFSYEITETIIQFFLWFLYSIYQLIKLVKIRTQTNRRQTNLEHGRITLDHHKSYLYLTHSRGPTTVCSTDTESIFTKLSPSTCQPHVHRDHTQSSFSKRHILTEKKKKVSASNLLGPLKTKQCVTIN